ncbi:lysophospholipid acyltransferase 7 [Condylostylus longicornis]|uniref:lysophospholipid acyltransferase 7 n=1 Tax=Condylostylus longicornis TaxID=2530218 RepID=UPI00244E168C|nr:lysophospholipid acyltransferase 7 [Condylostylus longicornis]
MSLDDVLYLLCLLTSIAIGPYFCKLKNDSEKKLYGTILGVLVVFIVSGFHILHCFISFALCAAAILCLHPCQSHVVSFFIMFGYLAFFRITSVFGIPSPPGPTNMVQMILTLKLAGVAFEKNTAYNNILQRNKDLSAKTSEKTDNNEKKDVESKPIIELTEYDMELQNINVSDLFHYCFNYIGILTGPYYRYRTYRDYFETPFSHHADSKSATIEKLKWCATYGIIHVIAGYFWPLSYVLEAEFYEQRSLLYRFFYIWPTFLIFRMRIYTGLILGESVCTSASFGAYPDESDVAKGEGPRKQYLHLKRDCEKRTYNFDTIKNIDVYYVETGPMFRETLRNWNICVQYWLAMNVYKRFPSKKYRTVVTLLTSAFWHGFYPGHYLCIMGGPFYVPIEDIHHKLWRKDATGLKRKVIDIMFLFSKFFALSYLGMAFVLLTFKEIWHYYSSVYHLGYIYYFILVITGLLAAKQKKQTEKAEKPRNDTEKKVE